MAFRSQCMSVKSKNEPHLQCPRQKKFGDYCGIHNRCKKVYRIDKKGTPNPKILINLSPREDGMKGKEIVEKTEEVESLFYDRLDFLKDIDNLPKIRYDKLIRTLREFKIQIKGGSKKNLVANLVRFLESREQIKQAYENLQMCNNETDFYDFVSLSEIPKDYLFIFQCQDSRIYGLDIRSLHTYFEEMEKDAKLLDKRADYINPYNRYALTSETLNSYYQKLEHLKKCNLSPKYPEVNQSPADQLYFKTLDVFHIMSNYGYPVNASWFINMTKIELLDFYRVLENFWNRRLNLTISQKKRIVGNDNLFMLSNTEFNQIKCMELLDLQNVLIGKIEILISNGITRDDRIQGIHYCLYALSEVIDIGDTIPL